MEKIPIVLPFGGQKENLFISHFAIEYLRVFNILIASTWAFTKDWGRKQISSEFPPVPGTFLSLYIVHLI